MSIWILCSNAEHHFPKIFRTALPTIKEIVLGHPLFWDLMTRVNFFAKDISLRLNDDTFMSRVRASKIRKLPWNEGTTQDFKGLLFEMETYRKDEGIPAYDFRSLKDYVRCVCGAYAHWNKIKVMFFDMYFACVESQILPPSQNIAT